MEYEIRTVQRTANENQLDVEYNHPEFGWHWTTAGSDDPITAELFAQALAFGPVAYVPPTTEELRALMPAISKRQLRLVLIRHSISVQNVRDILDAMPESMAKQEAIVEWEDAAQFERMHPTLLAVANALSLSPAAVDAMWIEAQAI